MKKIISVVALFALTTNLGFLPLPLSSTQIYAATNKNSKKLVLGCPPSGFFACFLGVLNHLAWCEKNKVTLVVHWDKSSLYYEPNGYNGSKNAWEYYFEPVSTARYNIGDSIRKQHYAPDGSHIKTWQNYCATYTSQIDLKKNAHNLVKKYIKIKKNIMNKVNGFVSEHISGKNTIAIHLRGTDKHTETRSVDLERIAQKANELAKDISGCQFFVATDEAKLLEQAKKLLNGKVIYYDSQRSLDGKPVHKRGKNKAQVGEEVLIETLLLAHCNKLVHTCSNVSTAALFFNPELDNYLLT